MPTLLCHPTQKEYIREKETRLTPPLLSSLPHDDPKNHRVKRRKGKKSIRRAGTQYRSHDGESAHVRGEREREPRGSLTESHASKKSSNSPQTTPSAYDKLTISYVSFPLRHACSKSRNTQLFPSTTWVRRAQPSSPLGPPPHQTR